MRVTKNLPFQMMTNFSISKIISGYCGENFDPILSLGVHIAINFTLNNDLIQANRHKKNKKRT